MKEKELPVSPQSKTGSFICTQRAIRSRVYVAVRVLAKQYCGSFD